MEIEISDEELVGRALEGNPDAFSIVMRRWEKRIFALAFSMLGSKEDALDVTQETFIAAYRNLSSFRGEAKVSSWLHRIAINQAITRQRRAKVRAEVALDQEIESNGSSILDTSASSPMLQAEKRERRELVQRAINALPPELREVVLLKEFEEMTFQEIAETLDIPLSTVKSRLYTALKQLRSRLEKFGLKNNGLDEQKTLG
jgi:RNA polymerase sigma-70 factor, ECF subfamily